MIYSVIMTHDFTTTKGASQYISMDNTPITGTIDSYRDYGSSLSSTDQSYHPEDQDFHLSFWDKLGLMALGTSVVCLTLCIVVCTVGPGCCIYNWISTVIV